MILINCETSIPIYCWLGSPASAKTFLLEQLAVEEWCLFDAGGNIGHLEDAIREMCPRRIVIDDAHFDEGDRILQIRRLRREMEAEFCIVAVTWPGQGERGGCRYARCSPH